MLPTSPQSVFDLFVIAIKSYKKLYVPFLKITAFFIGVYLLINFGLMLSGAGALSALEFNSVFGAKTIELMDYSPLYYFLLVVAMVVSGVLGFSWLVYFTYKILADGVVNYIDPIKNAFKKLLSFIFMYFLLIIPMVIVGAISVLLILYGGVFGKLIIVMLGLMLLPVLICFLLVSVFEVLLKGSSVFVAVKKALYISFKIRSMLRIYAFLIIFGTFTLVATLAVVGLSYATTSGLMKFMEMFVLKAAMDSMYGVVLAVFSWVLAIFSWLLLSLVKMVGFIIFYNDLLIRYEDKG